MVHDPSAFNEPITDGGITKQQFKKALQAVETDKGPIPGFYPNLDVIQYDPTQGFDCDKVYPTICIGNAVTARCISYLKELGVTHILNTVQAPKFKFVNTDESFYADTTVNYLGLSRDNLFNAGISRYFYTAANFIDKAISSKGDYFSIDNFSIAWFKR